MITSPMEAKSGEKKGDVGNTLGLWDTVGPFWQ